MDARSPLSARASAFSIASLVAAEASEGTAHRGPRPSDRAKLRRLLGSPAGMHFSTVTRDMEGEPSVRVYTGRPAAAPCCEALRPSGWKEALGRVGSNLEAGTLGQEERAAFPKVSPPTILGLQPQGLSTVVTSSKERTAGESLSWKKQRWLEKSREQQ